jgi:hypothetical protein
MIDKYVFYVINELISLEKYTNWWIWYKKA